MNCPLHTSGGVGHTWTEPTWAISPPTGVRQGTVHEANGKFAKWCDLENVTFFPFYSCSFPNQCRLLKVLIPILKSETTGSTELYSGFVRFESNLSLLPRPTPTDIEAKGAAGINISRQYKFHTLEKCNARPECKWMKSKLSEQGKG